MFNDAEIALMRTRRDDDDQILQLLAQTRAFADCYDV
jgi:hypothetical protein